MTKAKSAIPEGFHSVTPYLIVDQAKPLQQFITVAFGATERFTMAGPDGIIRHAEARIGDSILEFAQSGPTWSAMPGGLHYYVPNVDEVYSRAIQAGGASLNEPIDRDYGDREAGIRDPAGNLCFIATQIGQKSYRPDTLRDLNTYFSVEDAGRFLQFIETAFQGQLLEKEAANSGSIVHAKIRVGDTTVEVGEGRPAWGPRKVAHHYYVENCDAVFARGLANCCRELQPMADQFYGDRSGSLLDAWGNHWYIASHTEDLTPEQMAERAAAAGR